jgi:hypothetical protein
MSLNLFDSRGTPLDTQRFTWKELVQSPISKLDDDAFTRVRVKRHRNGGAVIWAPLRALQQSLAIATRNRPACRPAPDHHGQLVDRR